MHPTNLITKLEQAGLLQAPHTITNPCCNCKYFNDTHKPAVCNSDAVTEADIVYGTTKITCRTARTDIGTCGVAG
ncbi:MAG: hypothetical protein K2Q15_10320, partial [Burkholderiales bacterium]|nr:hypothetical protein [Burkholderiales bacterium]